MDHIPTMAAVMTPFPFYVDVSESRSVDTDAA